MAISEADYYYNIAKWISNKKRESKVNEMTEQDFEEYKNTFPDAPTNRGQISSIWKDMSPIWR